MTDNQIAPHSGSTDMGLIMYICYAVGLLTGGLGTIVGVVIAYVQRGSDAGSWRESHNTWLIRTFWVGFAAMVVGWILTMTIILSIIGLPLIALTVIWYIVRLVKGWMAFDKKQPIAKPDDLLFG